MFVAYYILIVSHSEFVKIYNFSNLRLFTLSLKYKVFLATLPPPKNCYILLTVITYDVCVKPTRFTFQKFQNSAECTVNFFTVNRHGMLRRILPLILSYKAYNNLTLFCKKLTLRSAMLKLQAPIKMCPT